MSWAALVAQLSFELDLTAVGGSGNEFLLELLSSYSRVPTKNTALCDDTMKDRRGALLELS